MAANQGNEINIENLNDDSFSSKKQQGFTTKTTLINFDQNKSQNLSSKSLPQNDLLNMSFLLSIFDNIVGPKNIHHWTTNTPLNDAILKYIAIHTLNGELYQDKLINQHKYRLYIIKEVDLAIFSVFFDASTVQACSYGQQSSNKNTENSTNLNCFSLIVPLKNKNILFDHYGDNNKFFMNSFEDFILEYKVYAQIKPKINKITTAVNNLTDSLRKFCSSLDLLRMRGIYPINFDHELKSSYKILVADTYMNDCYFTTPTYSMINNDFLVNAISSHIISNFNTIVIGKSSASMKKMINTLAIFMPKEKLKMSCYALEEYSMLSPYFCLQGFVTENPEELNLMLEADFIFKKESPTTIVDMSFKQVYRTNILNDFNMLKENFIQKKIQFLYNSLTLKDLNAVYPVSTYLNWISSISVAQNSTLLKNMLKQMDVLESDFGVKDSFIDAVLKDYYLLSLSLIEYVNNETINALKIKKDNKYKFSMKKACKDLYIKSEDDLNILISYANCLKPGFSNCLIMQA